MHPAEVQRLILLKLVELTTQNSNNSSKENEIKSPDNMLKKIEKMERKTQHEHAEASVRRMAQRTQKESGWTRLNLR